MSEHQEAPFGAMPKELIKAIEHEFSIENYKDPGIAHDLYTNISIITGIERSKVKLRLYKFLYGCLN